jgi:hypothetical protein
MKKYAVFLFAVFAMERIMAQDPADLLLKSRAKCLELNKVYYEMTEWFKPMRFRAERIIINSGCTSRSGIKPVTLV